MNKLGDRKVTRRFPFSIDTILRCRIGRYSFPWIVPHPWTVPYNAVLRREESSTMFLSLWYESTWDWTHLSQNKGEHSNHYPKGPVKSKYLTQTIETNNTKNNTYQNNFPEDARALWSNVLGGKAKGHYSINWTLIKRNPQEAQEKHKIIQK